MIRFVAMTPELFGFLPVRDVASAELARERHAVCAAPNLALAMLDGGELMAAAGVVQVWRGRGYAWLTPGFFMERRHWGRALARCRIELDRLATDGMWRIECTVKCGTPAAERWAARLGFVREGTMAAFGPDGADHELLARVSPTHRERRSLIERMGAAA